MPHMTSSAYAIQTTSMTPKTRLSPSASRASTPPSSRPLITASRRKMSLCLQSQICLLHYAVRLEFRSRSGELDASGFEQIGAVDHVEQLLDVLLDDEHG